MRTAALVAHPTRAEAAEAAQRFIAAAAGAGIAAVDAAGAQADVIVALGGDGTILRAARVAAAMGVPLLGVNVGRLGFLAAIEVDAIEEAASALAGGSFQIEDRMLIQAEAQGPEGGPLKAVALNEIVLEKAPPARVIEVEVSVGTEAVSTYTADGFIVATPTGSTAYSLSAGGPVLEPSMRAMLLTAVSAHYPLWPAVVVCPERPVGLTAVRGPMSLTADGQPVTPVPQGATVRVTACPEPLQLVALSDAAFFRRLHRRFRPD